MEPLKLCDSDRRFMLLVWAHEPIHSAALVTLCQKELGWKKSTTYTVLRRLCDRGIFQNQGGVVTSLLSYRNSRIRPK